MTSFWEILKSSKNLKASDAFAELWGKSIADSWDIITITGTLPLTFEAKGEALTDYRIYGTENGAGVQTENLWNPHTPFTEGKYVNNVGTLSSDPRWRASDYISVNANTQYTFSVDTASGSLGMHAFYDSNNQFISTIPSGTQSFTTPENAAYARFSYRKTTIEIMLTEGSTAPASYIPYGYQIPLTVESGETENLIDPEQFIPGRIDSGNIGNPADTTNISWNSATNKLEFTTSKSWRGVITQLFENLRSGDKYTYSLEVDVIGSIRFAFYDENGIWLDADYASSITSGTTRTLTVTVPEGASKLRIANTLSASGEHYLLAPMLVKSDTAPDHYIPHRYTADYNLYIGSTKLGAEEYIDFAEQKIYKDVSGTLTPTNPPIPLPALSTYQGENTLSSEETVGEVSVTGKIKEI